MKATTRFRLGILLMLAATAANALWAQAGAEEIRITLGRSVVIDYPEDIARISTSTPDVVDAVPATTREILLHGKSLGGATVVVWSKGGQRTFYNVTVEQNLEPLRKLIKETFPGDAITVQGARDTVSITGKVTSQSVADRVSLLAAPYGKAVVNNLAVLNMGGDKQIVLRVRFAEVDRTTLSAFGVNLLPLGGANTFGRLTTQQFSAPSPSNELKSFIGAPTQGFPSLNYSVSDLLNIFAFRPDLNLAAFVKALQNQGMLQILAEPNLVTTNGKEASFLVGGEFPVPVLQGGSNAGAVTIQFREFGIRLTFNPLLTDGKTIKMMVRPEVSTIDLSNAVTFNGFTIPALATRRIETNVELGEGQSFVIGGLLDDRVQRDLGKIPGLASIPVLGELFKSRQEKKTKTELIVMVTPEFTTPLAATDPKPMPVMPREFLPKATPDNPYGNPQTQSKKKSK